MKVYSKPAVTRIELRPRAQVNCTPCKDSPVTPASSAAAAGCTVVYDCYTVCRELTCS